MSSSAPTASSEGNNGGGSCNAPPMHIRVRTPANGILQIKEFGPESHMMDLLLRIEHETGMPFETQQLLRGFPPRPIVIELSTSPTLGECGVRQGDQLILKEAGKQEGIIQGKLDGKYVPPSEKRGYFVRRAVPADNSCLFHALAYALKNRSRSAGAELRALCAQIVLENPHKYTAAFLGTPTTEQYYAWISDKDTWGGAIEIRILSDYFNTEIISFDTCTTREDRFGEDQGHTTRSLIIYTGNHYDVLALAPHYGAPESQDQVVFSSSDTNILQKARAYVQEEHLKWKNKNKS